jgi:hypothetical protein
MEAALIIGREIPFKLRKEGDRLCKRKFAKRRLT